MKKRLKTKKNSIISFISKDPAARPPLSHDFYFFSSPMLLSSPTLKILIASTMMLTPMLPPLATQHSSPTPCSSPQCSSPLHRSSLVCGPSVPMMMKIKQKPDVTQGNNLIIWSALKGKSLNMIFLNLYSWVKSIHCYCNSLR